MNISGGGSSSATPTGWPLGWWASQLFGGSAGARLSGTVNALTLAGFVLPCAVLCSKILFNVVVADGGGLYNVGIYNSAGVLLADIGARALPSTGLVSFALNGAPILLPAGRYYLASTGNSTTAQFTISNPSTGAWSFLVNGNVVATASGVLPATVSPPADSNVQNYVPNFALSS